MNENTTPESPPNKFSNVLNVLKSIITFVSTSNVRNALYSLLKNKWSYIFTFFIVINVCVFFFYNPNPNHSYYSLYNALWYADFRYWPDWLSYCCWLVFVWSLVSLVISIFVPQNSNRQLWFRQTFYQKLVAAFALFSIWITWYNCSTLPLSTIFKPVSTFIHENYTQPLTNLYLAGYGYIIYAFVAVVVIALVTLRFWRLRKRGKHSDDTTTTLLLLVVCLQTTLCADEVSVPPKVSTSTGTYDIQSADEIYKFTQGIVNNCVTMR